MGSDEITRDGFGYADGRFYTTAGRTERVPGSALRAAFLPKMTPAGSKYLRHPKSNRFVRSQLKHYGVTFDKKELTGNGTQLLKKALLAGKCDQVPAHIAKLRDEMHAEWLSQLNPVDLGGRPDWAMDKYFLTAGQPDRAKTTAVVGFPMWGYSPYAAGEFRRVAGGVSGLHCATGNGPLTPIIFVGWDAAAVDRAAKRHVDNEAKAMKAADDEREAEREALQSDYLKTLGRKKGAKTPSPVGTYIVRCKEIEKGWDGTGDLSLDIRATAEPGIYEASFDFSILEGAMIMATDKKAIEDYCLVNYGSDVGDESDDEDDSSEDDEDDSSEDEEDDSSEDERPSGSKRRRAASAPKARGRGRPPKKAKASSSPSEKYHLKLKCMETGEGHIFYEPEDGHITFHGENMASFTGTATLPCVDTTVRFTGRKTSDVVHGEGNSWSDYSEAAHLALYYGRRH